MVFTQEIRHFSCLYHFFIKIVTKSIVCAIIEQQITNKDRIVVYNPLSKWFSLIFL